MCYEKRQDRWKVRRGKENPFYGDRYSTAQAFRL
jgi:hypothetical protein